MPWSDFWIVMRWWGALFLIGAAAFPLASRLFSGWYDRGYLFSKAVGLSTVTWIVFVLGMAHIAPFTAPTIWVSIGVVFVVGVFLHKSLKSPTLLKGGALLAEEFFFLAALLFWSWIKAHEPSIRGLEKFMDYGFMNSILHSRYFPPADMWYPPYPINYYYFGHLVTALLTRLSGLDLSVTFNLMLATLFALCLTMSFSIGKKLTNVAGGILSAFLVTLAGNMQTIYAFTEGYGGDNVKPFWQLGWTLKGLETYWYANATRFIPYTIHEFPSYSFVVSDVHGHVLSIPFVLLGIGLLIVMFTGKATWAQRIFYGFLCGVMLMTNALDGPIYAGLFLLLLLVLLPGDWMRSSYWKSWGMIAAVVCIAAGFSSLPFLAHFTSFVNGVAVNCPPAALANSRIGPILFESVDKCQKSPFWMMWLLWGFFWFCGVSLIIFRGWGIRKLRDIRIFWEKKFTQSEKILVVFFIFSVLLIIFPEFFYFKDIYPSYFRSNTMFKLGYQAFILFSLVSAYTIVRLLSAKRAKLIFFVLLVPQLFLVSIYPIFSVRSYFGGLTQYRGLYGLTWLATEYPDNFRAITWLDGQFTPGHQPVILEADGDSYTDYDQFSVFAGTPTVIGWAVHEWLWRGTYDVVSPRRQDVATIYTLHDISLTRELLKRYHVQYIVVGILERQKYPTLDEKKFATLGHLVFRSGLTAVYKAAY